LVVLWCSNGTAKAYKLSTGSKRSYSVCRQRFRRRGKKKSKLGDLQNRMGEKTIVKGKIKVLLNGAAARKGGGGGLGGREGTLGVEGGPAGADNPDKCQQRRVKKKKGETEEDGMSLPAKTQTRSKKRHKAPGKPKKSYRLNAGRQGEIQKEGDDKGKEKLAVC